MLQKDKSIAGYMPLQCQSGFIYDMPDNVTIAHELPHGVFRLRHTFSEENETLIPKGSTENLMDYTNGTALFKYQWEKMHNPDVELFAFLIDEEESLVVRNEVIKGKWQTVDPPQLFEAKTALSYNKIFIPENEYIRRTHTLVKLVSGEYFLSSPEDNDDTGLYTTYWLKLPTDDTWYEVYLSSYNTNCLSCEIDNIAKQISKRVGVATARYILPVEDVYIVVYGEDFDGEEASRIAAGGFLILEVVQVGKVFKLAKGAKILGKGGKAVNVSTRVMKRFAGEVSKDAAIDIFTQFTVHFIEQSIKNPDETATKIAHLAWGKVKIKDAVIGGMVSYASLDNKTQELLSSCATAMFRRLQDGGTELAVDIRKGTIDCGIEASISIVFNQMKSTEQVKKLLGELQNGMNSDIVLSKFADIIGSDEVYKLVQKTITNSIKNASNE